MEYAKISLEIGTTGDDFPDGIVDVWWWKDTGLNTKHNPEKPIWDILDGESLYNLMRGDTIHVPVYLLNEFFKEIEEV